LQEVSPVQQSSVRSGLARTDAARPEHGVSLLRVTMNMPRPTELAAGSASVQDSASAHRMNGSARWENFPSDEAP
jgi:hypothetical protein